MSIYTLVMNIGIVALLWTLIMGFILKIHKSWIMTFFQNFAGILFVFSGWVKAVDPLGTAYKMEDYFAEFHSTFSGTVFNFIAPLFPLLSEYSTAFAIIMIIFEIILGLMLLLGAYPKITSWAFLLLVVFFTVLTGFTFLTGYVPQGVNFFSVGDWGAYKLTNMRVTDCGCFGDFIKLEPKISFYKDLVLLVPAFYFIFNYNKMHSLLNHQKRNVFLVLTTIFLIFYTFYNFYWNEPHVDFRPFKIGADVAAIKKAEMDAMANVQVTGFELKNTETGDIIEVGYTDYLANMASYPKPTWEVLSQIKTKPSIEPTKIYEFDITDLEGNNVTNVYLENEKLHIMLLSGKAYVNAVPNKKLVQDSIFTLDTVRFEKFPDSLQITKNLDKIEEREESYYEMVWDDSFISVLRDKIKPFIENAKAEGIEVSYVISGVDDIKIKALEDKANLGVNYYTADEKLIKTIGRSNPGILLWQNGVILEKWHYKKLPAFENVKAKYLKVPK